MNANNHQISKIIVRRLLRDMESAGYSVFLQCPMTGILLETTEDLTLYTIEKSGRTTIVFTRHGEKSDWIDIVPTKKWDCLGHETPGMRKVVTPIREWIMKARS